jgi:alpha-L-rhamnosidase
MNHASRLTTPIVRPESEANLRPRYAIESASWIWHPTCAEGKQAVVRFVNRFSLGQPATIRIHVSADQRYELLLDGGLISRGPDRSDVEHWNFASYDLTLAAGDHQLEATVWWIGEDAPAAQMSWRPGFILAAEGAWGATLDTGRGAWRCADRSRAWTFENRPGEITARLVGSHQTVHGDAWFAPCDWCTPVVVCGPLERAEWFSIRPGWRLRPSELPEQVAVTRRTGRILALVPGGLDAETALAAEHLAHPGLPAWQAAVAGAGTVTVPPRTTVSVLWDLGGYWCGHSQATLSGGAGSELSMQWMEALFERPLSRVSKHKGRRQEHLGKFARGPRDSFRTDGGSGRAYTACWWRSGCLVLVTVTTAEQPLTIDALTFRETRYPLEAEHRFGCDDPGVERVVPFAERGMQMCAHETFMDCPHWEQTLYLGDTRLHNLINYTMSGDARLARRCIELFDWSRRGFGYTNSSYPYAGYQLISTFPLYWVMMVRDFAWWRDDAEFVRDRLSGVRANLDAIGLLGDAQGLIHQAPGWVFVDTVPEWIGTIYSPDPSHGLSSIFNLLHALALQQAAELEDWAGEGELAARCRRRAAAIIAGVSAMCWDAGKALMADHPDRSAWSQHAQILALLTGAVPKGQEDACLTAMLAAPGLAQAQPMYWMHYLFDVFHARGCGERLLPYLAHWRSLMDETQLRTPYEMFEPARSDCHAWGSHPLFHLHATIAGIRPAAPGFARVRISPAPGPLRRITSQVPHPRGRIDVALTFDELGRCHGRVDLPDGVSGDLVWRGRVLPLHPGSQTIDL